MADQLYLSYWFHGYGEQNMLRHYEKALRLFPFSRLSRQASVLRIIPVSYNEPAAFERAYPPPFEIDPLLIAAREFQHADSCYRLESAWDLWQFEQDWRIAPSPVALCCFGPEFDSDGGENLRVEFGLDAQFLPQPDLPDSVRMVQSNIRSLLKLVHDLDDRLGPERRQLWSESGENFPEKLQEALSVLYE